MGNASSSVASVEAPAKRPTNKLSKPRTGTALLSPGSTPNSKVRFSGSHMSTQLLPSSPLAPTFLQASNTELDRIDELAEPTVQRHGSLVEESRKLSRRMSLFRSKSSRAPRQVETRWTGPRVEPQTSGAPSRANSINNHESGAAQPTQSPQDLLPSLPGAASRISWNYNMMSYEAKRLLNMEEEAFYEQSVVMSEQKLAATMETTWSSSHATTDTSIAPVTRTNSDMSLYTPVRRRSLIQTPGVATRSCPAPPPLPTNFRHSHPPTPTLSRQHSVESYQDLMMLPLPPPSTDLEPLTRVITPCEADYQSIGAFKLGSLRIMNGSASPGSPEVDRSHARGGSLNGMSSSGGDYFSKTRGRKLFVTNGLHAQSSELSLQAEAPKPQASPLNPAAQKLTDVERGTGDTDSARDEHDQPANPPQQYSSQVALIPTAPSSPSPPSTNHETMSRVSAVDARLLEDDEQPEYPAQEVLDVRLDLNAKSQAPGLPSDGSQDIARRDSGFPDAAGAAPYGTHQKPLSKADSGYSSTASVRSLHAKSRVMPVGGICDSEEKGGHEEQATGSLQVTSGDLKRDVQAEIGAGDEQDASPVLRVDFDHKLFSRASKAGPEDSSFSQQLNVVSLSEPPLSDIVKKPDRIIAVAPGDRATSSIPQNAQDRLHKHTGLFPITAKRLAPKLHASQDTLRTIVSEDSFDAAMPADILREPETGPSKDVNMETSAPRKYSQQPTSSPAEVTAHKVPRKPIIQKLIPTGQGQSQQKEELVGLTFKNEALLPQEAELTTYSSISCSLGNNAYDAAIVAISVRKLQSASESFITRRKSLTPLVERLADTKSQDKARMLPSPGGPIAPQSSRSRAPFGNHHRWSLSQRSSRESLRSFSSFRGDSIKEEEEAIPPVPPIPSMHSIETPSPDSHASRLLSHRSSYDDYYCQSVSLPPTKSNCSERAAWMPYEEHMPSNNMFGPWTSYRIGECQPQSWDQQGYYYGPRRSVPRDHNRHRSMSSVEGGHGAAPPWRVLHSYNSPAYRNVPVWR